MRPVRDYWHDAARAMKRAVLARGEIELCGSTFRTAYESRAAREGRDYPLLAAAAEGKQCVFDVGANVGLTSLVMSTRMAPAGRIHAFEASEEACRVMEENLALNGLSGRSTIVNGLIGAEAGTTQALYGRGGSGGASTIPGYLGHEHALEKVVLSLDRYVVQHGLRPDLLKIDVEGAELAVLEGAREILESARPLGVVELHSWSSSTVVENTARILPVLRELEYTLIYSRSGEVVEDPAVLTGRGRCHGLLVPREGGIPGWLASIDTSRT